MFLNLVCDTDAYVGRVVENGTGGTQFESSPQLTPGSVRNQSQKKLRNQRQCPRNTQAFTTENVRLFKTVRAAPALAPKPWFELDSLYQGCASVLFKRTFRSLDSFAFFIKERSVLCVLLHSL